MLALPSGAGNVRSTDNIFSKSTFGFWMFSLEHSKWATSDNNSGFTSSWSLSWMNGLKLHTWFSIFEESWSTILFNLFFLGFFTRSNSCCFLLLFFLNFRLFLDFFIFNSLLLGCFDGIIIAFILFRRSRSFFGCELAFDTFGYIYYRSILSQRLTQEKRDSH